jgi:hypothetical protein
MLSNFPKAAIKSLLPPQVDNELPQAIKSTECTQRPIRALFELPHAQQAPSKLFHAPQAMAKLPQALLNSLKHSNPLV